MGPQASAKLVEVIIAMCSKEFGARNDEDFPEIALSSVPVPDFISNKKNLGLVLEILKSRVKSLENFNPACFGIACNTAHLMIEDLQITTNVPFISIMNEVSKEATKLGIETIGLLSTPTTAKSGLYSKALEGIDLIIPTVNEQKTVEKVIRNVLAGKSTTKDKEALIWIANNLRKRGARGIILGCTELPLIFPKDFPLPVFDSIEILARGLLKKFYEN